MGRKDLYQHIPNEIELMLLNAYFLFIRLVYRFLIISLNNFVLLKCTKAFLESSMIKFKIAQNGIILQFFIDNANS